MIINIKYDKIYVRLVCFRRKKIFALFSMLSSTSSNKKKVDYNEPLNTNRCANKLNT